MSSSKSEADLRVKVLNVLKQFKEPFDAKAFKKAYKRQYEEKFSSGELPTRDYLMSFREISYNEEEDNFMFSRKEVKVEDDESSSDDEGSEDAPEVREEVNERVRDDEQCWYNKEEFRRLVRSLKTELEKNPDPAVSEEDINLFVKLHLLRNISLGVVAKIIQKSSDSPPFFYLKDFSREWKVSQKNHTIPCDLLGLTLCGFFKSFLHMQTQGNGRFAISGEQDGAVDSSAAKSVAGKIIDDGKKVLREQNEKKKPVGIITEESKRAESALHLKVLAMAIRVSQHSSVDGFYFYVADLSLEWQRFYGEKLVPCAQFGFCGHIGFMSFLESIPELHRITNRKFAIRRFPIRRISQPEFDSNLNHEKPIAAKATTKKVLNERKKIDSGNMVETSALEDKANIQWYDEEEYQTSLRLYKEFLRTKKPDAAAKHNNYAIEKVVKLDLLKKKVLEMVTKVAQRSRDGQEFLFGKLIGEWRRIHGSRIVPYAEVGYGSLHGFLESLPELLRKNQTTYMVVDPLTMSGEKEADSNESSSRSCLKKREFSNVPASRMAATAKKPPKESSDEESLTDDDSDDEKKQQEETMKNKKMVQVGKKLTLKQVPSDKKKVPEQKHQMVTAQARKEAPAVFSSSIDSDTDSESDEATEEKVVRKTKKQPKTTTREMVVEPKTGIKEKKKSMEMEKRGRKSTIEDEPRKKALKRSHSPDVIVLDDDEPSVKVPKHEIQDAKETRLVGEEDLAKMAMPAYERTSSRGQRARMSGDGAMVMGSEGKVLPPLNMMDPSSSFMPPAPGFPMPGVPPLFCPTTQQQLNLSNGGVAALFMAQLLDNAEKKGMDVDAIALEAIQLIKKKMNSEK